VNDKGVIQGFQTQSAKRRILPNQPRSKTAYYPAILENNQHTRRFKLAIILG
jgi:hypothetical protein